MLQSQHDIQIPAHVRSSGWWTRSWIWTTTRLPRLVRYRRKGCGIMRWYTRLNFANGFLLLGIGTLVFVLIPDGARVIFKQN